MRRKDILELMVALGLKGMKAVYDEVLADAARRNHPPERVLGTLLKAEVADKKARSIKYGPVRTKGVKNGKIFALAVMH